MAEEKIPIDEETLERFLNGYLFSRTAAHIDELEKDRKAYRTRSAIERKKMDRERKKELKPFSDACVRKRIGEDEYQKICKEINDKHDKKMNDWGKKQGTADQNPYKGKDITDLNTFIYGCYYLFKKYLPVPKKDTDIYKWIEACLTRKDIKMKNGKPYDKEAIKTRVYDFEKKDLQLVEGLLINIFKSFIDKFLIVFLACCIHFRKPKPTTPANNFHVRLTI